MNHFSSSAVRECHHIKRENGPVYVRIKIETDDGTIHAIDLDTTEKKLQHLPQVLPFVKRVMDTAEDDDARREYTQIYEDLVRTVREAMGR